MPEELKAQMARAFVGVLAPVLLMLAVLLGIKVWRWFRRMGGN